MAQPRSHTLRHYLRQALPPSCEYASQGKEAAFAVGEDAANVIGAYVVAAQHAQHTTCVVVPDQFGWRLAQTRRLCDDLAAQLGARVVCPDVHRGNHVDRFTVATVRAHSECISTKRMQVAESMRLCLRWACAVQTRLNSQTSHAAVLRVMLQVLSDPGAWLQEHSMTRAVHDLLDVLQSLSEQGDTDLLILGFGWSAHVAENVQRQNHSLACGLPLRCAVLIESALTAADAGGAAAVACAGVCVRCVRTAADLPAGAAAAADAHATGDNGDSAKLTNDLGEAAGFDEDAQQGGVGDNIDFASCSSASLQSCDVDILTQPDKYDRGAECRKQLLDDVVKCADRCLNAASGAHDADR